MLQELINNPKVLNIYQWGSRVYGCFTDKSDFDYNVIVTDDFENFIDNIELEDNHFNFYKLSQWQDMIRRNTIETLECIFADTKYKIKESIKFNMVIDIIELRKSISKICSNAYDKCRKKLTIEKDFAPYIAKKSLWHCIRILLFGIQCGKYGRIIDYTEANKYYNQIVLNENNSWEYYKENWHVFCNNLRSEFRKYSEKEWIKLKEGSIND
jgi:hypothetical protein